MRYKIETNIAEQLPNIEVALKIIDPQAQVVADNCDFTLQIDIDVSNFGVNIQLLAPQVHWSFIDQEINDHRYNLEDRSQRLKEIVRLGIISVFREIFDKNPPWGILSGVRPTKIYHYLRAKGFSRQEIHGRLLQNYGLNPSKAKLLIEIGQLQEKFINNQTVSVYIGIPFCPTRCHYCSFPAVSLETHRHLVGNFLKGLELEIKATSALCKELGFKIESVYIGGGTPTSLDNDSFTQVLSWITDAFDTRCLVEFTVEAGRPETVSKAKIEAMVASGVNRISINPQTMQFTTLRDIGRNHSIDDIYNAVNLVKATDLILNMDLILGLPNETGAMFLDSLQKVIALDPENITVHTLAPKRAASWHKEFDELNLLQSQELVNAHGIAVDLLQQHGFIPYYLYRQRAILGDLENIGYAKRGTESVYNIQMMEERQTILGLGGGAVTKWVVGPDFKVSRHQNPKCPATYYQRVSEDIVKKAQLTRILLS